jgi:hypothetical protein
MKSEELSKKLTNRQREILVQTSEGKKIDPSNLEEVLNNVDLQVHNGILNNEYGLSEELWEDYREVYRYLNSLKDDEETRKENLIDYAIKEYQSIQEMVNKYINGGMSIVNIVERGYKQEHSILSMIGILYGFTDREVRKILNNMDISFKGINWEEVEVIE